VLNSIYCETMLFSYNFSRVTKIRVDAPTAMRTIEVFKRAWNFIRSALFKNLKQETFSEDELVLTEVASALLFLVAFPLAISMLLVAPAATYRRTGGSIYWVLIVAIQRSLFIGSSTLCYVTSRTRFRHEALFIEVVVILTDATVVISSFVLQTLAEGFVGGPYVILGFVSVVIICSHSLLFLSGRAAYLAVYLVLQVIAYTILWVIVFSVTNSYFESIRILIIHTFIFILHLLVIAVFQATKSCIDARRAVVINEAAIINSRLVSLLQAITPRIDYVLYEPDGRIISASAIIDKWGKEVVELLVEKVWYQEENDGYILETLEQQNGICVLLLKPEEVKPKEPRILLEQISLHSAVSEIEPSYITNDDSSGVKKNGWSGSVASFPQVRSDGVGVQNVVAKFSLADMIDAETVQVVFRSRDTKSGY